MTLRPSHQIDPYLQRVLAEHDELHGAFEGIVQELAAIVAEHATADDVRRVRAKLESLLAQLEKHFRQEEEGGYLEEAMCRAPELRETADKLQVQHGEFCRAVDELIAGTERPEPPAAAWRRLNTQFAALAKRLAAHEDAENALLERAFNEDLGTCE